ncbi:hypothetical protein [Marinomonas mediterranea]|jgi:hypothetical protein|uniref:Uncharacterized protein n=1 Tax=Marinomonas mediterranea (strain ATCC 700492 / JCM 21426 / NBRC 103028 / MMB-1) TaxID=717774 RepID=F2JZ79_MARM1|nr:hypothetical protein [Marinomonas mediterranea]ADZ93164.1 hypothetical protein Marme_3956 [Marinomonas mediterranea MMB-1]
MTNKLEPLSDMGMVVADIGDFEAVRKFNPLPLVNLVLDGK